VTDASVGGVSIHGLSIVPCRTKATLDHHSESFSSLLFTSSESACTHTKRSMELAAAVGNSIRTARGAHRTLCFVHARWQSMSGRNTRDKWTCVTDWQEQLHLHAVLCQCAVRGEDDPVPWQQVSAASAGRVHYSRLL
jgi:hypothetical protein